MGASTWPPPVVGSGSVLRLNEDVSSGRRDAGISPVRFTIVAGERRFRVRLDEEVLYEGSVLVAAGVDGADALVGAGTPRRGSLVITPRRRFRCPDRRALGPATARRCRETVWAIG